MRRFLLRILVTFSVLLWPVGAAALPGNIHDLEAELTNGTIEVHWAPPTSGDKVAYYRVYISHQSILDNNGTYDDYERTQGPQTEYTITEIPDVPQVFVAVLAVNEKGEESGFFTEEIGIVVPADQRGTTVTQQTGTKRSAQVSSVTTFVS